VALNTPSNFDGMRRLQSAGTRTFGVVLALGTAIISGFAIFINSYGVRAWEEAGFSTATYTTVKNIVAALLVGGLLSAVSARKSGEGFTRPARGSQWAGLVAVGLIGGSIPFLLFFEGLARASSSQAAFLHKTLLIWVVVLAVPALKERLSSGHLAALGLLLVGQTTLAGGITDLAMGTGEVMVLGATLMWSVEVIVAKKLLSEMSALTVGAARMALGAFVLVGYGLATGAFAGIGAVGLDQWGWALVTGLVLSGYVATWYSALARAQAIDVTAVLVFGAVITATLRSGFDGAALAPLGGGLVLVAAGVCLIVLQSLRHSGQLSR
jgi:drug/metabolite transporter (DMT)-like permease